MRRPRQERSSVLVKTHKNFTNFNSDATQVIRHNSTTSSTVTISTVAGTEQPIYPNVIVPSVYSDLFDYCRIEAIKFRFVMETATENLSFVVAFDPTTQVTTDVLNVSDVMGYPNAAVFTLTEANPVFEYIIENPMHISGDSDSYNRNPLKTEVGTINCGSFFILPLVTPGSAYDMTVYHTVSIQLTGPRNL